MLRALAQRREFAELDVIVFVTSQASLTRAYSRPSLSGSLFRRLLKDERIALDMLPHEFERLRLERELRHLDIRWQSGVATDKRRTGVRAP